MEEIELKFLKQEAAQRKARCAIHKTGRLGFSGEAIKLMRLDENAYVKIAINQRNENDTNLYLVVQKYHEDGIFKVVKAGEYYYLYTRNLFDKLKLDYENYKIMYDIREIDYKGTKVFQLERRMKERKIKEKE